MVDFRQLLIELERQESRGIGSVNSTFLAAVLNTSSKQASKSLSRLHSMGFLVREKDKRLCISKTGKECCKGYYYEYALSSQGRKYIRWMRETRPLRRGLYLARINSISPYLSEDEKGMLLYLGLYVQNEMRYKGPQPGGAGVRPAHGCCIACADWETRGDVQTNNPPGA